MPVKDGRVSTRPATVRLSRYTRVEQRKLQGDYGIFRIAKVNELDAGLGYVQLVS